LPEQSRGWNWIPRQHYLCSFQQPTKKTSHSFFDVMIEPDASCLSKAEDGRNEARGAQREKEAAQRAG
jgi:hypothetical protein